MTVSSATNRSPIYTAASTGPFAFTFKVFEAANLRAIHTDVGDVETVLTLDSDYTASLNADQNNNPGGEVTLAVALVSGEKLLIMRVIEALQETDIQNASGFYPEVIEDALDRITMLAQQNEEEITRAWKVDATSETSPDELLDLITASASAAAASATAADASADAADISEAAAAASAAAAAASAASVDGPSLMKKSADSDLEMNNNDITEAKTITFNGEYDNGNSGASKTIDFANGQKQKVTLTANTTLTISAPPAVGSYQLRLIQDATGGRTITWSGFSASRWLSSATAPTPNAAANGESIVSAFWDGAAWVQSLAKVGAE
jgi:hypothetical protein